MARHGYLREFDERPDRDEDYERDTDWREHGAQSDRDWRQRNEDRDWREASERNRSFMFSGRDERSDWERRPRNFRSSQDEHYRAWRDRQMEALDRDYAEYCAEREQQFHQDFDTWRRQRRSNQQPLQTGMTQTGGSNQSLDTLDLTSETAIDPQEGADPMAAATLGTSSTR